MVESLIEKGADPNLEWHFSIWDHADWLFYITLVFALYLEHLEIVKLLLAKGVHPDKTDFELATKRNHEEAIALLLEFSYDNLPNICYLTFQTTGLSASFKICNMLLTVN